MFIGVEKKTANYKRPTGPTYTKVHAGWSQACFGETGIASLHPAKFFRGSLTICRQFVIDWDYVIAVGGLCRPRQVGRS